MHVSGVEYAREAVRKAEALCKLLIRLEKEYGYDELNSMLVLKDILATVWKKRSEKKS